MKNRNCLDKSERGMFKIRQREDEVLILVYLPVRTFETFVIGTAGCR